MNDVDMTRDQDEGPYNEDGDPQCQSETLSGGISRRREGITFNRRLQLQKFAAALAAQVMEQTKPHERCLLNDMVHSLIPR